MPSLMDKWVWMGYRNLEDDVQIVNINMEYGPSNLTGKMFPDLRNTALAILQSSLFSSKYCVNTLSEGDSYKRM